VLLLLVGTAVHLQVNNAAILVRGAWDEATYNETMAVGRNRPTIADSAVDTHDA
jgi:hypothetical protein